MRKRRKQGERKGEWYRVKHTTNADGTAEHSGEARTPGIKMHRIRTRRVFLMELSLLGLQQMAQPRPAPQQS